MIDEGALIAVIGAGTMGAGIAQIAAAAGHPVVVIDSDRTALRNGSLNLDRALDASITRSALSRTNADKISRRIRWSSALEELPEAGLVVEAIVENSEAKASLFARITPLLAEDCIVASNTSSLSIDQLASSAPCPARFIGLHFFNPAPRMKLVEVVPGAGTLPEITDAAFELMQRWGKHPVKVRDVPGFIVNRVARPFYAEGFIALAEGIAPENIDHALTGCGGFRMGPLALGDLVGHDVSYRVATSLYDGYRGRTRFRPPAGQRSLVEAGTFGRKTGTGIYAAARVPQPSFMPPAPPPRLVRVSSEGGSLIEAVRAASIPYQQDSSLPYGVIDADGIRMATTDGRPLAARPDVDVLADVARDIATSGMIVLTTNNDAAAKIAAGLVQAIGRNALAISDRPGMIVLRTLAQLANAAADAVTDKVAQATAIDEAMMYGANHPEGPLRWAERIGRSRVEAVLDNITVATGDELYSPSLWFREKV